MTTQEVKRKLAVILSADVKGYSRLMGKDQEKSKRKQNSLTHTSEEGIWIAEHS